MSDAFNRREEGFETHFVLTEALRFKALARRNKLVGLWAAECLGCRGEEAQAYAGALVAARVERADDTFVADLEAAFAAAGVEMSRHRIERKLTAAMAEAIASLQAGR